LRVSVVRSVTVISANFVNVTGPRNRAAMSIEY